MTKLAKLTCIFMIVTFSVISVQAEEKPTRPLIQIAILLDTSNSMDGLIHQAKTQLWKIVNELATAKRNGQIPELQVALYEYGKDSLPSSDGYIRKVLDLTTDLDKVSEDLFNLKTNGGTEYCGWVISKAVDQLAWSKSNNDFKAIYIAGNEPFTQMPGANRTAMYRVPKINKANVNIRQQVQIQKQPNVVPNAPNVPNNANNNVKVATTKPEKQPEVPGADYRVACKNAISKGIIVNTIHCGSHQDGVNGKWQEGALLADGTFMNINQNRKEIHIKSPFDDQIMKLNNKLNKTYIPFGTRGIESKTRQMAQDTNASKSSYSGKMNRALSKASHHYRNSSWDLVDAVREGNVAIDKVKAEDLPENMKKMTVEERKAYVESQLKQRKAIQDKIKDLSDQRKNFVAQERKKLQASGEDTLDAVMVKSLRKQLKKKSYEFKKEGK